MSLSLSSSLFQEPLFPKGAQRLCGLLEPATSGRAELQSALNPYLVSVTGNLHLLQCHLFRCLLSGWSNPSATGQCFSKCKLATKFPKVWSWVELVCGDVLCWLISGSFSETEKTLSLKQNIIKKLCYCFLVFVLVWFLVFCLLLFLQKLATPLNISHFPFSFLLGT